MVAFILLIYFLISAHETVTQTFDAGYPCIDSCLSIVPAGVTSCPTNDTPCFCRDANYVPWLADCVGLSCPAGDFEGIANAFTEYCRSYGVQTTALSVSQFVDDANTAASKKTSSTASNGSSTPVETNSAPDQSTSSTNGNGLTRADIISIACTLGIGIPGLIIAFVAWYWPRNAKDEEERGGQQQEHYEQIPLTRNQWG